MIVSFNICVPGRYSFVEYEVPEIQEEAKKKEFCAIVTEAWKKSNFNAWNLFETVQAVANKLGYTANLL